MKKKLLAKVSVLLTLAALAIAGSTYADDPGLQGGSSERVHWATLAGY